MADRGWEDFEAGAGPGSGGGGRLQEARRGTQTRQACANYGPWLISVYLAN